MPEAIILAGGLGSRLRSEVESAPKVLAPVAGRPFVAYLLDQLREQGFTRIVLATGYLADEVEKTLGRSWDGMMLDYCRESEPLGTGGAIRGALRVCVDDYVCVLNGDTYLAIDYPIFREFVVRSGALAGVALANIAEADRYGAVRLGKDRVVGFREKGVRGRAWVNAGAYCLSRRVLEHLPETGSFSFEHVYLECSVRQGDLVGFQGAQAFIDIGVPEDYRRAAGVLQALMQGDAENRTR